MQGAERGTLGWHMRINLSRLAFTHAVACHFGSAEPRPRAEIFQGDVRPRQSPIAFPVADIRTDV